MYSNSSSISNFVFGLLNTHFSLSIVSIPAVNLLQYSLAISLNGSWKLRQQSCIYVYDMENFLKLATVGIIYGLINICLSSSDNDVQKPAKISESDSQFSW